MDKSENRTLIVKIVCVLLSFGLWLYISNVENPLRTYELKDIPVELVNENSVTDSKLAIVSEKQFTVDLKLEGPSSEVTKLKKEDFKIVADMSSYVLKSGENTIPVQMLSYPENINIKNNSFLGIKVTLEELVKKEFTIKSKVKITYKEHIYEKEQTISPKTVSVTGGKSTVAKINEAVLIGEENDLDKSKESQYDIKFMDSSGNEITNVESDNKSASLSIVATNGKTVPINLKTSGNIKLGFILESYDLSRNNIIILGDSKDLGNIESIDTEYVDMSSLQENSEINVKLNIPEGISIKDEQNIINVKFNIKKETMVTKKVEGNVQYKNLNPSFSLEKSASTVNVVLSGSQLELDKISADNINIVLDLASVNEEGTFSYKPRATLNYGNNVTIVDVESVSIVIKKNV